METIRYRYYIQDPFDGDIKGTNSLETAEAYAVSEDFYVIDTQTGYWIQADMERIAVKEAK